MLLFRLKELSEIVDYFVLVEANQTHSGLKKPFYFDTNLLNHYNIVHIKVNDMPKTNNSWRREGYQRHCIQNGLINAKNDDLIIISDIDEIPDIKTLTYLKNNPKHIIDGLSLEQDMYYYNLTCKLTTKWTYSKIVLYQNLKNKSPNHIRYKNFPIIENGGWHFSYFGDAVFIANKIKSFAHQEYNKPDIININHINTVLHNHSDLFNRNDIQFETIPIEHNKYLPRNYRMLIKND